ncbi:MAG: potassium channel family protein [Desulfobaccales bacterium]
MEYLSKILTEQNIISKTDLCEYLSNFPSEGPFKLINKSNLKLDSESRIYDDQIIFEKTIIDIPKLVIRNSTNISLINCIFTGDLYISQTSPLMKFEIDYCIILGELNIYSLESKVNIDITLLNCYTLIIHNCLIGDLRITHSNIFHLKISENRANSLFAFINKISFLESIGNEFDKVEFDHRQLDIDKIDINAGSNKYNRLKSHFNLFNFITLDDAIQALDSQIKYSKIKTLEFLKEKTSVNYDKGKMSKVLYLETILDQQNKYASRFMKLVGGFIKPMNVLGLGLCILFFFSILFCLPFAEFSIGADKITHHLTFGESLYFSGITFTTIGYGDIIPLNFTRFLVVIEGFLGILVSSSFIVTLVRKYIN